MASYIIIFLMIGIISKAISDYRKNSRNSKVLEAYEKNQPTFNHFKILPFDVTELKISADENGLYSLTFTPINVKQVEEKVFSIHVKSKYKNTPVEFEFIINNTINEYKDDKTSFKYLNTWLHTNLKGSDMLIHILASIFNVEISDKEQINRSTILFTQERKIDLNSIYEPQNLVCHFSSQSQELFSPCLEISFNLQKGEFKLKEIDPLFRPVIIEKLLFRKNIK